MRTLPKRENNLKVVKITVLPVTTPFLIKSIEFQHVFNAHFVRDIKKFLYREIALAMRSVFKKKFVQNDKKMWVCERKWRWRLENYCIF